VLLIAHAGTVSWPGGPAAAGGRGIVVRPHPGWARLPGGVLVSGARAPPAVAAGPPALFLATNRWLPRLPGSILALAAMTLAAFVLRLPIETIGTRFGGIPAGLPHMPGPPVG